MDGIPQGNPASLSALNLNLHEHEYQEPLREAHVDFAAYQQSIQEKSRRKMQERLERERGEQTLPCRTDTR